MTSCQPARASIFIGPSDSLNNSVRDKLDQITAKETFKLSDLEGSPVIVSDDVALYLSAYPKGINIKDVVATMAPPFNRFFIEFQNVPNEWDIYAWGALVTVKDDPDEIEHIKGDDGKPRWLLNFETFLEPEKGKPFGPVTSHFAGLAEDGTWFRHADGGLYWFGGPVEFTIEPPENAIKEVGDNVAQLLFPVLMTISFMHCKNVDLRSVNPPEKLSRKHRKKRGRGLIRYHVLDIEPIRKIFDKHGAGSKHTLRQALHICRGHFKTFTTDAPLFGKLTGTYWWPQHVRGSKKEGVVVKDYRVGAPLEFGKAYREADENPPNSDREAPPSKNPNSAGRGLAAHNKTQNSISAVVHKFGWIPRSPRSNEPEYDIAWEASGNLFVCEVKSLTLKNEERQLRMAMGQVIRYRQKLNAAGHEPVYAVIAAEREPTDQSWDELCEQENIILVWPGDAERRLQASVEDVLAHD
jgi:hypothetical protein